jgi:2,4-dienoyl-CoA reductase-like NADH-dependent reductase (Old Yellow Enzyme family)
VHSQGQKIGIQLGHAGRKASTKAPWQQVYGENAVAPTEDGGWPADVWGPSALPFSLTYETPREMTVEGIGEVVKAFGVAARRSLAAGMDTIEIHAAHGYLIHQFLSPLSNVGPPSYW